jgi:hypothetical protein
MANALTNTLQADYDTITANNAIIDELQVGTIEAEVGSNNVTVGSNLVIGPSYSATGHFAGDFSGNLYGNVIGNVTGNVTGNLVGNVTGSISGTSTGFTGSLVGDVVGTQTTTKIANGVIVDAQISSSAAIQDSKLANISTAGKVANSATTASVSATPNTIALRDATGALTATSLSTSLSGDVTGPTSATQIAPGVIVNVDINASAAIADTKLATIATANKVSNSATTATSINTSNAIVARDANGDFNSRRIQIANLGGTSYNGYSSILMSGGNSNGGIYPAFTTYADGIHFGYNYASYGSTDGQTPAIINTGGQATRISASYNTVNIAISAAANQVPDTTQERLRITTTAITAANGANFAGALIVPGGSATGVRTSNGTQVPFPSGIDLVNGQNISNVGTIQALEANLYNSTLGYGVISGAGNLNITTAGLLVDFNHRNLQTIKSLAINSSAFGADPISSIPLTLRSNGATSNISQTIGRTTGELELAVAGVAGAYASTSAVGDCVIRNNNSTNALIFGLGSTGYAQLTSSGFSTTANYSQLVACQPKSQTVSVAPEQNVVIATLMTGRGSGLSIQPFLFTFPVGNVAIAGTIEYTAK